MSAVVDKEQVKSRPKETEDAKKPLKILPVKRTNREMHDDNGEREVVREKEIKEPQIKRQVVIKPDTSKEKEGEPREKFESPEPALKQPKENT